MAGIEKVISLAMCSLISVSVDSWFEELIEALATTPLAAGDPAYGHLLRAASCPSEVFILRAPLFQRLIRSPGDNLMNTISTCLGALGSDADGPRLNAAAILSRIFPFLLAPDSPILFEDFLLRQTSIGDVAKTSVGVCIVETSLDLLLSFSVADTSTFFDDIEVNVPLFDLLSLTVFSLLIYCNNSTLFHQMIVVAQMHFAKFAKLLFNYVHLGGRRESLISLLTLLMFHPSQTFTPYQIDFVKKGGQLSARLCATTGDISDLLCSLSMHDDANPPITGKDKNAIRLGLAKLLGNSALSVSPKSVVAAYEATKSPISRVIMGKLNASRSYNDMSPPITDCVVVRPHKSEAWAAQIQKIVANTYLFIKSFWFQGTGVAQALPDFGIFDSLVAESP
jgi:hypothetical protein